MIIALFLFISSVFAYNTCPSTILSSCASASTSNCANNFEFNYNAQTGKWITNPLICAYNSTANKCVASTQCEPSCFLLKIQGGPNGWVCSDFKTQNTCVANYADNNGDRWCYWDNGYCHDGQVCHN